MIYAGVDIGGTGLKVGLVNEQGQILRKKTIPTGAERPADEIMADMNNLIKELAEEEGIQVSELGGVGVGIPGMVNPEKGELTYACNLPTFHNTPIGQAVKDALGLPMYLDNDANIAALGESMFGAGNGQTRCSVMITLGTGVGGGVIINGRIFAGAYHGGTELGHLVIVEDGEQCSCGRKGCWEAYSSVTGLIRDARRAAEADPKSMMWELCGNDLSQLNGKLISEAVDAGDEAASKVMDAYIRHLAIGLGNIYNVFQPEVLILGGGLSGRGDKLLKPLLELLQPEIYGKDMSKVDIRIATLGNDAGVIGAACLAMQGQ